MLGKGEKRLVAAYSAAHFAVDLCCAMLVLPAARAASDKAMALLIYNFCAFAMQLPIGVLADRYGGGRYFSAIGCPGRAAALPHAHRRRMRAGQRGLPYRRRGGRNGGDGGGEIPGHIRFTRGNGHIPRRAGLAGGAEPCRLRRLPHARLRRGYNGPLQGGRRAGEPRAAPGTGAVAAAYEPAGGGGAEKLRRGDNVLPVEGRGLGMDSRAVRGGRQVHRRLCLGPLRGGAPLPSR